MDENDETPQPELVVIPTRRDSWGDGDGYIACPVESAEHWDARRWRDKP